MPWKFSRPLIEQHTSCLPYCQLLVSFAVSILELPKEHNCTDFSRGKQRKVLLKASYLSMTTACDYKISMSTVNWINHFDHLLDVDFCCLPCHMSNVQAGLQLWYNNFQFLGYAYCYFFFHSSRAWGVVEKPSACHETHTTDKNSCGFQFTTKSAQSVWVLTLRKYLHPSIKHKPIL